MEQVSTPGLENFWYGVEHTHALQDQPVSVTLLGRRFLLYRDGNGQAHAMADYCAHRGASLAKGWIEGSCVRCPYHGWSYDTEGHCVKIPADPAGTPIPARARLATFPIREQSGFIWIFPGSTDLAASTPIPPFPELDQPGWRAVSGEYGWNAHFSRVVESGLDTSHAPFVHKPFFGNREEASVESLEILSEPGHVSTHQKVKPPKRVGLLKYIVKRERSHSSSTLTGYLPNVNRIALDFNWRGYQYIYFASNIPVNATTTLTKWIGVRNFLPYSWADRNSIRNTTDTYEEDRAVVETQPRGPSWTTQGDDLLLASDQLILAYRRALAKACPSVAAAVSPSPA
jgi:phenylpropionate dioxygenase-like ring-hydroxylating dioxygenase large terminal subunit